MPLTPGQADVHQHQGGIRLLADMQRPRTVIGLSHHAKLRIAGENGADAIPNYPMVVNYYNVKGHSPP